MKRRIQYLPLLPALMAGFTALSAFQGKTQSFTNVYNFSGFGGASSTNGDGANPSAGLVLSGNSLYGTTLYGGQWGYGSVFKVNTDGSGFTNLHSFTNGADGASPVGSLVVAGNTLYGTTQYGGGTNGNGSVFKVNTDGTGYANLHSFSASADGAYPAASLVLSGSFLYGTASGGGASGAGTVFRLITNGTSFLNLHNFDFGTNGSLPYSGLIVSGSTLYGTTTQGGASSEGTVFKINTDGSTFTTLHSFTGLALGTNSEGVESASPLVLAGGILFGTTPYGGTAGFGTVFALRTDGGGFTNLHNFTGTNDGENPAAGLVISGNTLYGTTATRNNDFGYWGTVFSLNTNGSAFNALYSFLVSDSDFIDGAGPAGNLVLSNYTLYGTTKFGGPTNNGAVFKLGIHPAFFAGEDSLGGGVYYLVFPNNQIFGFYNYIYFPYLYHYNLGFEYFIDANDGAGGAYLYDFTSGHFWYTGPNYSFPYIYDFTLQAILYYYPDPNNGGQYSSNPRSFYNFATGQVIFQ